MALWPQTYDRLDKNKQFGFHFSQPAICTSCEMTSHPLTEPGEPLGLQPHKVMEPHSFLRSERDHAPRARSNHRKVRSGAQLLCGGGGGRQNSPRKRARASTAHTGSKKPFYIFCEGKTNCVRAVEEKNAEKASPRNKLVILNKSTRGRK